MKKTDEPGRLNYFAFGSNLDPKQMELRVPKACFAGKARARGYRLGFAGQSLRWGGGVAEMQPQDGSYVEGVIYSLPKDAFERLDRFEGNYNRKTIEVELEAGETIDAEVYMLKPRRPNPPSQQYWDVLIAAYEKLGFDAAPLQQAVEGKKITPAADLPPPDKIF